MFLFQIPDTFPAELIGEYLKERSPDRFLLRKCETYDPVNGKPHIRFPVGEVPPKNWTS